MLDFAGIERLLAGNSALHDSEIERIAFDRPGKLLLTVRIPQDDPSVDRDSGRTVVLTFGEVEYLFLDVHPSAETYISCVEFYRGIIGGGRETNLADLRIFLKEGGGAMAHFAPAIVVHSRMLALEFLDGPAG